MRQGCTRRGSRCRYGDIAIATYAEDASAGCTGARHRDAIGSYAARKDRCARCRWRASCSWNLDQRCDPGPRSFALLEVGETASSVTCPSRSATKGRTRARSCGSGSCLARLLPLRWNHCRRRQQCCRLDVARRTAAPHGLMPSDRGREVACSSEVQARRRSDEIVVRVSASFRANAERARAAVNRRMVQLGVSPDAGSSFCHLGWQLEVGLLQGTRNVLRQKRRKRTSTDLAKQCAHHP